ncbi:MAG: DoxX family membrane protein [Candidatus Eisenbacteria bacterium]|nr:DoxX family membrane protein [Candidatus Eisenbacteria bacterium]
MSGLRHRSIVRLCQIAIGVVLLASSLAKLGDLRTFATQIGHYHLVPLAAVNLMAMTLPWVELTAGLALVVGVWPRSAAWTALAMMLVFTVAIGTAMARGLDFECGCFGTADATRVGAVKLGENLLFIALAAVASLAPAPRRPDAAGQPPA